MAKINEQTVDDLIAPPRGYLIVWDSGKSCVDGFGIRITANDSRAFVLRYNFDDENDPGRKTNEYRYTIGKHPTWSVTAARAEAKELRKKIDKGIGHPMASRKGRRSATIEAREAENYAVAVADYIRREQEGSRNNATSGEVSRVLLREGDGFKDRPVASVTAVEIRNLLESIRDGDQRSDPPVAGRPYLANRFHAYLGGFFRWCAETGIQKVPMSPMLGMRRPWEGEEARSRFFNDEELKAIWKASDKIGGVAGAFVKVSMLTGKRRGALSAMRWSELDENGVWTPPKDTRRKARNKRNHVVPLSNLALRVIAPLRPRVGDKDAPEFVFAGVRRGTHLDPGTTFQAKVRETSGVSDFIVHALRHSVETRMAELGVLPHIRDFVLDHAPHRGAGGGYDHHHYLPEMRAALERWAGHIEGVVAPQGVKVLR